MNEGKRNKPKVSGSSRAPKPAGQPKKASSQQPLSKRPSLPQQPISVPYRIKILSQLLARRLQRRLDPFDLTPAHFMVLNCLWRQDGLAISDIGEKVQQVGGTMTGVIDRMEERNLIVRKRDAEDRRVWRAWLTDKGKKLFSKLPPVMAQAREQLLDGISEREIAQLIETLDKIIVNAQAEFE